MWMLVGLAIAGKGWFNPETGETQGRYCEIHEMFIEEDETWCPEALEMQEMSRRRYECCFEPYVDMPHFWECHRRFPVDSSTYCRTGEPPGGWVEVDDDPDFGGHASRSDLYDAVWGTARSKRSPTPADRRAVDAANHERVGPSEPHDDDTCADLSAEMSRRMEADAGLARQVAEELGEDWTPREGANCAQIAENLRSDTDPCQVFKVYGTELVETQETVFIPTHEVTDCETSGHIIMPRERCKTTTHGQDVVRTHKERRGVASGEWYLTCPDARPAHYAGITKLLDQMSESVEGGDTGWGFEEEDWIGDPDITDDDRERWAREAELDKEAPVRSEHPEPSSGWTHVEPDPVITPEEFRELQAQREARLTPAEADAEAEYERLVADNMVHRATTPGERPELDPWSAPGPVPSSGAPSAEPSSSGPSVTDIVGGMAMAGVRTAMHDAVEAPEARSKKAVEDLVRSHPIGRVQHSAGTVIVKELHYVGGELAGKDQPAFDVEREFVEAYVGYKDPAETVAKQASTYSKEYRTFTGRDLDQDLEHVKREWWTPFCESAAYMWDDYDRSSCY